MAILDSGRGGFGHGAHCFAGSLGTQEDQREEEDKTEGEVDLHCQGRCVCVSVCLSV